MEIRRCMKCMHELKAGETVCPECGEAYGSWKTEPFALKPGTILEGKYLVGEMLGQGGFGITYIGFDLVLEQKVAIKEYFPMSSGVVSRENSTSVVWSATMMEKGDVQKGFDGFLKEARKMAKLGAIPSVVGVKTFFIQNETAYIVMDFVEGETLLKKLERKGTMEFDACVSLLTPIMEALIEVHKHGIIHRDISPDNIMVRNDGKLILLDLGAAKDLEIRNADGTSQSSQLVAKHGFSPVEQYGRAGKIGPWTDVYAMAATIYYCCTGCLPPASTDRISDDPLTCKPHLNQSQFDALRVCMTVLPEKRPQDMAAMLRIVSRTQKTELSKPALPKWLIPTVAAGVAVLCIAIGISSGNGKKPKDDLPQNIPQRTTQNTVGKDTKPNVNTEAAEQTNPAEQTEPLALSLSEYTGDISSLSAVSFSDASATSELNDAQYGKFPASNAIDGNTQTSWQEGEIGYGIGESITLTFPVETEITVLSLHLGNTQTEYAYYANGRPSDLQFSFSDGTTCTYHFKDELRCYQLALSRPVTTKYIRITIQGAYEADWQDTAISEITAYGGNHEHIWNDANIMEPKTCKLCGVTEGYSLGHSIMMCKIVQTSRDTEIGNWQDVFGSSYSNAVRFWVANRAGWENTEDITFHTGGQYDLLELTIVSADKSEPDAAFYVSVYADGQMIYVSDEINNDMRPVSASVAITGAEEVKVICTTNDAASAYCIVDGIVKCGADAGRP